MRVPLVAGNWKMFKTQQEATQFAADFVSLIEDVHGVEVALCPPFTALAAATEALRGCDVGLGGQDCFWEEEGAFTGQVAPHMLVEVGCEYVIIGHSERRGRFGTTPEDWTPEVLALFGDSDQTVNRKVKAALAAGLTPIICMGETADERDRGETDSVVRGQLQAALDGVSAEQVAGLVIAYEPVWAIGTGKAATPGGAGAVIGLTIRGTIAKLHDEATAQAVRVQYGGSVNPSNVAEFMAHPDIDGALVGGASLKPDFVELVRIAAETKAV